MPFKTLFIPLAFEATARVNTEAALLLAGAYKAHVSAYHVRQRYAAYPPIDFFPAAGAATPMFLESHNEATAAFAGKMKSILEACCQEGGATLVADAESAAAESVTASWSETAGLLSQDYGLAARVADLVVVARPDPRDVYLEREIFEALLMESGAPVLAVPPSGLASLPRRPLVAWDGSLQASRVVRAAMPLLLESEETVLLTIGETDAGTPGAEAAQAWLDRAGVKVTSRMVDGPSGPVAERILNQCDATGADIVVMGGYSHSRLREAVMGGVTLHMLKHADRPLLMVH